MNSLDGEETNICLRTDHKENEVNSLLSHHYLFWICKKLNKETSKLKQLVSIFKEIISSLDLENKNLLEIKSSDCYARRVKSIWKKQSLKICFQSIK